jgi:phage tail-like protein
MMDVNRTRFHLLLGKDDWAPLVCEEGAESERCLYWDPEHASVSLWPRVFQFPQPAGERELRPELRRGAARDRYGNWYWIDERGSGIRVLPVFAQQSQRLWPTEGPGEATGDERASGDFRPDPLPSLPEPMPLSGLTVTEHHYLVAGVLDPRGLQIIDLHGGGPPVRVEWPAEVPFHPIDFAPAPGGGLWILDREPRYWALDEYFQVVIADSKMAEIEPPYEEDFQPEGGPPRRRAGRTFPEGIALEMASPIEIGQPLAIEALPDGTVLILDGDSNQVYRYRFGKLLGEGQDLNKILGELLDRTEGDALHWHDIAFVPNGEACPDGASGTLYAVNSEGNQAFGFALQADDESWELMLLKKYFPMRLFGGKAIVTAGDAVYYDHQDRWLKLVEKPRRRYTKSGEGETHVLDGKEPNCVWHRLFLDACIPPSTEVIVESRASNDPDLLKQLPWQMEPRLYRRSNGSEIPYYRPFSEDEIKQPGTGTWELLFQSARGRYLQLRLKLRGNRRSTPRLRAARVYYPRFSYLKEYLPAVYQHDEDSASFLERFLANMEGLYTALEGRIQEAQMLFDVQTADKENLDWLAGWFDVILHPAWEETRRRLFIKHAVQLFQQRGTIPGLTRAIRLSIDPCPDDGLFEKDVCESDARGQTQIVRHGVRIVEQYLTRSAPGVVYGDPTDVTGPSLTAKPFEWTPAWGADPLHETYQEYLCARYPAPAGSERPTAALNEAWGTDYAAFEDIRFSPVLPTNPAIAEDWRRFLREGLGFTYAVVTADDETAYQAFLARRYRQVTNLHQAYRLTGADMVSSFSQVPLPAEDDMPAGGTRLYDWIQFVSLVLPIRRNAHHFKVLIPVDAQTDLNALEERLQLVRNIVALEKPAHTVFQVKPYWDLFRLGEARVGLDTLLDIGSRLVALMLGKGYLGESYLASEYPWSVTKRIVSGRDPIGPELIL